ncbi:hypothetical protein [Nonomuraea sp. NPDC003709]|uniref:hypothetical protein n=1 Tax=Nonomuraea sp. NPDC003709 TaxID=3154450 RepID=UPI0033AB833B
MNLPYGHLTSPIIAGSAALTLAGLVRVAWRGHRSRPAGAPVLIHLHGGGYSGGGKDSQSLPLRYRLAGQGGQLGRRSPVGHDRPHL